MKQYFFILLFTLLATNSIALNASNVRNKADTTDQELIELLMFENSEIFKALGWAQFLWEKHKPRNQAQGYWIRTSNNPFQRADHNPEQQYIIVAWKATCQAREAQTRF